MRKKIAAAAAMCFSSFKLVLGILEDAGVSIRVVLEACWRQRVLGSLVNKLP